MEGWSAIGSWQGAVLSEFLKRIGADTRAKYIWFKCAEGYTNTIDMPTALHPQTQMSFKFDHKILPRAYGFPMKIRMPTKLGFKNPKYVVAMEVTNTDKGGYWENQGYNWFAGCSALSPCQARRGSLALRASSVTARRTQWRPTISFCSPATASAPK